MEQTRESVSDGRLKDLAQLADQIEMLKEQLAVARYKALEEAAKAVLSLSQKKHINNQSSQAVIKLASIAIRALQTPQDAGRAQDRPIVHHTTETALDFEGELRVLRELLADNDLAFAHANELIGKYMKDADDLNEQLAEAQRKLEERI